MEAQDRRVLEDVEKSADQLQSLVEHHPLEKVSAGGLEEFKDCTELEERTTRLEKLIRSIELELAAPGSIMNSSSLADRMRQEYSESRAQESKLLMPECPQLRVLLLGRVGVGKSTLCSKILGLPEEEASIKAMAWFKINCC